MTTLAEPAAVLAQPTAAGKRINRLTLSGGRIYPGYGDYGANTGPIHALGIDPDGTVHDEATLTTEQLWQLVDLDGVLAAPFMDPEEGIGNPEDGSYAVRQPDGSWDLGFLTPYAVHCFDMAATSEGWWACGSSQVGDPGVTAAQVWFSADQGTTWTASLTEAVADDLGRFYALAALGDDLLALMTNHTAGTNHLWHRTANGEWTDLGATGEGSDLVPFTHNGTPIAVCIRTGKATGARGEITPLGAYAIPGHYAAATAALAAMPHDVRTAPVDACVSGGHLYVLTLSRLWKGTGVGEWTCLGSIEEDIRAMAVDEPSGVVYLAAWDSTVHTAPLP